MKVTDLAEQRIYGIGDISLLIQPRKDGKADRLIFETYQEEFNSRVMIEIAPEQVVELVNVLEEYLKIQDKAYTEEISTYVNEIERSLMISPGNIGVRIFLDVYTDQPYDDNWMDLTPGRLTYFVGLLYGYLKSWGMYE